jgi:hypothetical protein
MDVCRFGLALESLAPAVIDLKQQPLLDDPQRRNQRC